MRHPKTANQGDISVLDPGAVSGLTLRSDHHQRRRHAAGIFPRAPTASSSLTAPATPDTSAVFVTQHQRRGTGLDGVNSLPARTEISLRDPEHYWRWNRVTTSTPNTTGGAFLSIHRHPGRADGRPRPAPLAGQRTGEHQNRQRESIPPLREQRPLPPRRYPCECQQLQLLRQPLQRGHCERRHC